MAKRKIDMGVTIQTLQGKSNITHARSIMLTEWYDKSKDGDLFLFIDSDQTFTIKDNLKSMELIKSADVVGGIYSNLAGKPTVFPINPKEFYVGHTDNRVYYVATGFMMISRTICSKVIPLIEKYDNVGRVTIGQNPNEKSVIPFFQQRFIKSELQKEKNTHDWLGEDYGFCWLVRQAEGTIRAYVSDSIGHEVYNMKFFAPVDFYEREEKAYDLVYFCGMSKITFSPDDENLGGSEQAVVNLAREWQSLGKKVIVFGNVKPGIYDSVVYKHFSDFEFVVRYKTVIVWRGFGLPFLPKINANKILIDLHDNTDLSQVDMNLLKQKPGAYMIKSKFHQTLFPQLPQEKFHTIPNAISKTFLSAKKSKNGRIPNRFCYTSCYTRGLEYILRWCWPKIYEHDNTAELHVYYGMDLAPQEFQMKMNILFNVTKGVIHHGRQNAKTILQEKQKSTYHLYPSNCVSEIDCISVRESVVVGLLPILSSFGIFKERLGVHIDSESPKEIATKEYQEKVAARVIEMMDDSKELDKQRGKIRSQLFDNPELSWTDVAEKWLAVL